jgi:hypothetical protein
MCLTGLWHVVHSRAMTTLTARFENEQPMLLVSSVCGQHGIAWSYNQDPVQGRQGHSEL